MTAASATTLETGAGQRRPRGVSRAAAVGWLLAFALLEWARGKFEPMPGPYTAAALSRVISALEGLEVVFLVRLYFWPTSTPGAERPDIEGPAIGLIESLALLAVIAIACVLMSAYPVLSDGVIGVAMLARFGRSAAHRALAIALFAFVAQYLLQTGPFIWLHAFVGQVDAGVVRTSLQLMGYDVTGAGTYVVRASHNFAIDVLEGCSSSYIASVAIPGFVIVVLGLRGRLLRSDLAYAAAVLVGVVLINWARLLPIALSHQGWLYWHEGPGSSIIAAVDGVLVVGAAWRATRRGPAAAAKAA